MSPTLPNEVILAISTCIGQYSSFDLKPLSLIARQWHTVVASSLLSTIAVSSLENLLSLCDHVSSIGSNTTNSSKEFLPPTIANHTKTIVINGVIWPARADCHIGLEDLGEVGRGENEDIDECDDPESSLSFEEVSSKIQAAFKLLVALDGLEWYGRFAGDYYLVRYLQKSGVIRRLSYGIDMQVSSVSLAYRENAFLFEGLKYLAITTEYEPEADMFEFFIAMVHRNHDLEHMLFDCKYAESMSGRWSLDDIIFKDGQPFIWPNLKHLVLRYFRGGFWQSPELVQHLLDFLVTHPYLETLVLRETCPEDPESETALPLSLSSHPDCLPNIKKLYGSNRLIAGVLEGSAACSSITTIVDNSEEGFDIETKAGYIDRILTALRNSPQNRVQRLSLIIPQLDRDARVALAHVAPKVQFLEFLLDDAFIKDLFSEDQDFSPLEDIPTCLNDFPNLKMVGFDVFSEFRKALGQSTMNASLELARRVPTLEAICSSSGIFFDIARDPDGEPRISGTSLLNNFSYDHYTFEVDWRHRPMPYRRTMEILGISSGDHEEITALLK